MPEPGQNTGLWVSKNCEDFLENGIRETRHQGSGQERGVRSTDVGHPLSGQYHPQGVLFVYFPLQSISAPGT